MATTNLVYVDSVCPETRAKENLSTYQSEENVTTSTESVYSSGLTSRRIFSTSARVSVGVAGQVAMVIQNIHTLDGALVEDNCQTVVGSFPIEHARALAALLIEAADKAGA